MDRAGFHAAFSEVCAGDTIGTVQETTDMQWFARPMVAVSFGAFMLCAETCLHADAFLQAASQPLDLPIYDWLAGGFLLAAGVLSSRQWTLTRRQYQTAAWAFMLSLLTGAVISHLAEWLVPPVEPPSWGISETGFLLIIVALTVIAACGLVSTVRASSERQGS